MNSIIAAAANRAWMTIFINSNHDPKPILPGEVQDILSKSSDTFEVAQRVFIFIGIGILIYTTYKIVTNLLAKSGGLVDALKSGFTGITAALFCFNLQLMQFLVSGLGKAWARVFNSLSNVIGGG
jgi:hypothetical protein